MARQRLSQKFSLNNLKNAFNRGDRRNDSDSNSDYEEDHIGPRLRRAASRLSLRSQTRENTRRNSQMSTNQEQHRTLRSQGSSMSMRLPFGFEFTFTRHGANQPPGQDMGSSDEPSRTRNRASTLATDSEGHVHNYRDGWYTAPPPSGVHPAFRDIPQPRFMARNDSVPHYAQEQYEEYDDYYERHHAQPEEQDRPPSPTGSDDSNRTARAESPPPRPPTPPPHRSSSARQPPTPPAHRTPLAPRPPTPPPRSSKHGDSGYYSRGSRENSNEMRRMASNRDRRTSQAPKPHERRTGQAPLNLERRTSQVPLSHDRRTSNVASSNKRVPAPVPEGRPSQSDNASLIDLYASHSISSTSREHRQASRSNARYTEASPAGPSATTSKPAGPRPMAGGSKDPYASDASLAPCPGDYLNPTITTHRASSSAVRPSGVSPPVSPTSPQPPRPLRRKRGVTFREPEHRRQREEPQPLRFPEPIPQPEFESGRWAWRVGAELCAQVEREEVLRARASRGERQQEREDE
ncbi:hypothetical protein PRZ48_008377 [Zasmidium cellare]|uniref:Uncharacterized protein n=1 Tax=Zasmidium cellare TaxID=395010 RepID=A0ABR0EFA9_ZASCE|nr:hypothetical protein PRZ48_008377 [Zasmidium cellare]